MRSSRQQSRTELAASYYDKHLLDRRATCERLCRFAGAAVWALPHAPVFRASPYAIRMKRYMVEEAKDPARGARPTRAGGLLRCSPPGNRSEKAAYEHGERRGWTHGHDREDWVAAEQDLTFDMNYQTLCRLRLDERGSPADGRTRVPRCRFCEQSTPKVKIGVSRPVFPRSIGSTLSTCEVCTSVPGNSKRPSIKISAGSGTRWPLSEL